MTDSRRAPGTLVAVLVGYVVLVILLLHADRSHAGLITYLTTLPVFAVLVVVFRRVDMSPRNSTLLVLGAAAALQLVALTAGPTTSDDVYRYVWDGRVQFDGIDPYAHAPQSPDLAHLRDPSLFPQRSDCTWPIPGGCSLINRPAVRTVYPPAAQLVFDLVHLVTGGHGGVVPFQVLAALGVLAVTALLLVAARRRGVAVWPVALWAWSPLVIVEYGNNAHLDWLAALLGVASLVAARGRRAVLTGFLLATATLTKLYPALLAVSALRRRPVVVIVAGAATGALLYLPHLLAVGTDVIGYLPGYLGEEGYDSGSRLLLLGAVFPHPLDTVVGALLLVLAGGWAVRRTDPDAPECSAVLVIGIAFLVTTPAYGWYAGLLLALCVLSRRLEWLPVAFAPAIVYLLRTEVTHASLPATGVYALAGLVTAALVWRERRMAPAPPATVPT